MPTGAMCSELEDLFGVMIEEVRTREEAGEDSASQQVGCLQARGSLPVNNTAKKSCTSSKLMCIDVCVIEDRQGI